MNNTTVSEYPVHEISAKLVRQAIALLPKTNPHSVDHFLYNCEFSKLQRVFGKHIDTLPYAVGFLYGMQLRWRGFVPVGEVWAMDRAGRLIQKYKV